MPINDERDKPRTSTDFITQLISKEVEERTAVLRAILQCGADEFGGDVENLGAGVEYSAYRFLGETSLTVVCSRLVDKLHEQGYTIARQ